VKLITPSDARRFGLSKYFTGKPCKHGHIAERNIRSGTCVVCTAAFGAATNAARIKALAEAQPKPRMKSQKPPKHESPQAARRVYYKTRIAKDPKHSMNNRIRSLIASSLRIKGYRKPVKTEGILGCTLTEFRAHIERQFLPKMNWENRHLWEIDHIVPMGSAASEDVAVALNHFTNLRPMWTADNRKKGDCITHLL